MTKQALDILDDIAAELILVELSDTDALTELREQLEQLKAALPAKPPAGSKKAISQCLADLTRLIKGSAKHPEVTLDSLNARIENLAATFRGEDRSAPAPAEEATGGLVLPPWVDEELLREFVDSQKTVLDDLEADALALEGGGDLAAIRRRIHTLKGESGVLGLERLQELCHELEDYLVDDTPAEDATDAVLAVKDWTITALQAYGGLELPPPVPEELVARLAGRSAAPAPAEPAQPAAAVAEPEAAAPAPAAAPVPTERDADTIELFGEFLQEADDGLVEADRLLMNVEQGVEVSEAVNGLFRVFHTIKGVAGFLELDEVTALAHTTETMLNMVRQDQLELSGDALNLVFDATSLMRQLMNEVRAAVDASTTVPAVPQLGALLSKLEAVIDPSAAKVPAAVPRPAAPPTQPAPEIAEAPADVEPPAIEPPAIEPPAIEPPASPEAAAAPARAAAGAGQARAAGQAGSKIKGTIKVDLERVDQLVEMIGELVIVESMVVNTPEILGITSSRARNYLGQLSKITRNLQGLGTRMRMVPVRSLFQKMARMVRDLSRKSGKTVRLDQAGEWTEMDRSMVEQLADPLVHMIRNAVDHGIEDSEGRAAAGKPACGTITLSAYHEGGSVVIELSDDGKGLQREALLNKAKRQGLIGDDVALSDSEILDLIFHPGFSTAKKVTELSGRGVGMDVVRKNIEAMRGRVSITSTPGKGTAFKLMLPLTLAIIDGMLVACGQERYIIPTLTIIESVQPEPEMLVTFADELELINLRGEMLPLLRLGQLLAIEGAKTVPTEALVVVVEGQGRRMGLLVDDVVTQQQVVIKSMGTGLEQIEFVSGAAILSDGRVGLILNVDELGQLVDMTRVRRIASSNGGVRATR